MPPADPQTSRLFRRTATIAAAISLLFVLWAVWMAFHFNAGAASVKFSAKTMLRIAAVGLSGPLLLAILVWNARRLSCRVTGWTLLPLALLFTGMLATYTTIELRPPFAPGDYDAAVKEAEARFNAAVYDEASFREFRQIRDAFKSHPKTREEYGVLAVRAAALSDKREANNKELHRFQQIMEAPFDKRAVSTLRRDEYLRLVLTRVDMPGFLRDDDKVVEVARLFEQRLRLLVEHWGHWQWTGPDTLEFDEQALNDEYDRLIEKGKNPAR